MEAITNHETKRPGARFGADIDPVEAGRRGGVASGIARRLKPQRDLEARVLESRNGAAAYALLRDKRRQHAALERAQVEADWMVVGLMEQAEEERARIARLRAEVDELEARRAHLESDDDIRGLLEQLGEDRVTELAIELGWGDDDEEDDGDVAA
jgi:hypothetical protein